jgi:hypothetical protein
VAKVPLATLRDTSLGSAMPGELCACPQLRRPPYTSQTLAGLDTVFCASCPGCTRGQAAEQLPPVGPSLAWQCLAPTALCASRGTSVLHRTINIVYLASDWVRHLSGRAALSSAQPGCCECTLSSRLQSSTGDNVPRQRPVLEVCVDSSPPLLQASNMAAKRCVRP